jgi:hypothetical protein
MQPEPTTAPDTTSTASRRPLGDARALAAERGAASPADSGPSLRLVMLAADDAAICIDDTCLPTELAE